MKYKSPKKPGDLIRKVNATKKHHKQMAMQMRMGNDNATPVPKYRFGESTKTPTLSLPNRSMPFKPGGGMQFAHKRHKKAKDKKHSKHKKNWIAGAIKHPGALHRQLGVKQGRKIPAKTLARAASKGGTLGRRARLAETLKGLHK